MSQPATEPTAAPPAEPGDTKPRTADTPKTPKAPKPPPVDPEAPYGWIIDPDGTLRPKKRPGRQKVDSATPPPNRPSAQARQRPAPPRTVKTRDYREPLTETVQGFWMILAGIPTPDKPVKVVGIDMQALSIRAKAQAAILDDNAAQLVHAVNLMAGHNKQVARGVERWTADTGPAWILPAMMAMLPFAVQSAQIWREPIAGDAVELAKRTDAKFEELIRLMSAAPQAPGESLNGDSPPR